MGITGADFKDWVLVIAGNIFIVIFVIRAIGYYAKKEWGEMIAHIAVAIVIAGFIYMTDDTMNLLKAVWSLIVGGTSQAPAADAGGQ